MTVDHGVIQAHWDQFTPSHWRIQGGRQGRPRPNFFIFIQFSAKKLKNNSTSGSWRTPPRENPGSDTDSRFIYTKRKRARRRIVFFNLHRCSMWTLNWILYEPIESAVAFASMKPKILYTARKWIFLSYLSLINRLHFKQESIPVGCIPSACQPYPKISHAPCILGNWVPTPLLWTDKTPVKTLPSHNSQRLGNRSLESNDTVASYNVV